ncbi:MAG: molecular chaperone DnaJ [Firmicutes bacterium HGW-Firmicutes-8]|nr:MAG: molecular chaperone DnaJ [Firmicutes bacterium HGW-Firmicutes-8]
MSVAYHDYYETLGIGREATEKEIKTAYRKMARKWHPDLHREKEKAAAEEKFKRINEAYEVLSDPEKRAKYDTLGANWQDGQDFRPPPDMDGVRFYSSSGAGAGGFSEFFETLFGSGDLFGRTARKSSRGGSVRGQDAETELEITLEEAYRGGEKALQLTTREICSLCGGTGHDYNAFCSRCGGTGQVAGGRSLSVKIPPGVHDGSRIRLKGQGGEGIQGGARGDLYLKINILPHPVFKVTSDDLETEIILRPEQAVMGDQVTAPTLDGPVTVKVPPRTRGGKRLRLRGKGLPGKQGRGDEYVRIRIDIPENLTAEEEQLYRQLAGLKKGV